MKPFSFILFFFFLIILISCKKDKGENTSKTPVVSTFVSGLSIPWQMAFMPDGRILLTERPGRVRVIENKVLKPLPYLNLQDTIIATLESGLLGIAVDVDFATNHFIYVGYTYEKNKNSGNIFNKLVRYKEDVSTKKPVFDKVLIDNIGGDLTHNSGAIKFGPDGKLYWPVGDRFESENAQDLSNLNGKILRLNRDGSIPNDNPFPNSYIYTYGHRHPQGIAWQPGANNLFATEHGPSGSEGCCNDEINLVERGKNYGWPVISGLQHKEGMVTPVYYSGSSNTWAPCGITFIKGGPWNGSLLFTGLRGESLYRAIINAKDPKKIDTVLTYFKGELGRLRTVAQGPDGTIYIATSNRDNNGVVKTPEDDRILILSFQ